MSAETPIRGTALSYSAPFQSVPSATNVALGGVLILLTPLGLWAQAPMGIALRVNSADLAILETREVRKDLVCTVTPNKPELGFDLRFHGGFDVSVPLNELAGAENQLTILFRVIPDLHKDQPRYFVQHIHVPEIADNAKGDTSLRGMVDLGEGSYHVDWLMRDRSERVCSFYWDSEAALPSKDKQIELALPPGTVERMAIEQFGEEPPVERAASTPLNIKVLVNFAPQFSDASAMRPIDTMALVTMLRRIAREPQFGKFSLVAFNIQEQRVLYRQANADKIDFPALGEAVHNIKLGIVDVKHLAQKHGESDFLADLIKKELAAGGDRPDAVIIAGPKIMLDDAMPEDQIRPFATDVDFPVFYVNYNLYPQDMPFKDSVSHAVKLFRGTEFTISRPRDVWFAVTDMVSRIVKSKHGGIRMQHPPSESPRCTRMAIRWPITLLLTLGVLPALAQDPAYVNRLAPYVNSPARVVDRMLELASIRPGETVYDLGCGDGRILIAAVQRFKAKAIGIEISPKIVAEARSRIKKAGVTDRAQVIQGDLLQTDLTGADVVTIYLATSLNEELRPRLEKFLKPGARVVSHDYAVPGWKPTQVVQAEGRQKHPIYLYEMPPTKQ